MVCGQSMTWEQWRSLAEPIEAVVNDPDAAPEELEQAANTLRQPPLDKWHSLLHFPDEAARQALRAAILSHPNTPIDTLKADLAELPEAFCRNPHASRLLLETPDFVMSLRLEDIWSLLRYDQTPVSFLARLTSGGMPMPEGRWHAWGYMLTLEVNLHVACAGECADETEWRSAFRAHWYPTLATARSEGGAAWHMMLAWIDYGLAPEWLIRECPRLLSQVKRLFLGQAAITEAQLTLLRISLPDTAGDPSTLGKLYCFFQFFQAIHYANSQHLSSYRWEERLAASLAPDLVPDDCRAKHFVRLANDGNRLVRFVARKRLTDPTWGLFAENTAFGYGSLAAKYLRTN